MFNIKRISRDDLTLYGLWALGAVLIVAVIAATMMLPSKRERAVEAVTDQGFEVVSVDRTYKLFQCYGEHTTAYTVETSDAHTLTVCVGTFRTRVKD